MPSDFLLPIAENLASNITTRPINAKRFNSKLAGGKPCLLNIRRDGVIAGTIAIFGVNLANPWRSNEVPANPNSLAVGVSQQQLTGVGKGDGATLTFNFPGIPFVAFANFNYLVEMGFYDRFPLDQTVAGVSTGFAVANHGDGTTDLTFGTQTLSGDGATTVFTVAATTDLIFPTTQVRNPANQVGRYFAPIVKISGVTKTEGVDYTWTAGATALAGLILTFTVAPANAANNITVAFAPAVGIEFGVSFVVPVALRAASSDSAKQEISGKDRYWAVGAGGPNATDIYVEPAPGG